jgi:hydroxymethylglutaryl-CoA synthase
MTRTGIEAIHFYTANFSFDLRLLAAERGVDVDKFYLGIGQEKMSIAPPDEDVVTLAANAAKPLVDQLGPEAFQAIILATESGIDQSKSAAVYVHKLLGLTAHCRAIELKHACYGGTAGLQMAAGLVARNAAKKVLVIASDVARYDMNSPGESTQGCGAVAMVVSNDPKIMVLEEGAGYYTQDVMDFWRPNYRDTALVDGKYSAKVYLESMVKAWDHFVQETGRSFEKIAYFCYHLPFTKMAEKAHQRLHKHLKKIEVNAESLVDSLNYNRIIGNSYTASLYIGLCSLLDRAKTDLSGKRVALFSYGSGCVAEFFSGVISPGYQSHLLTQDHQTQLHARTELDYQGYAHFYQYRLPQDGSRHVIPCYSKGHFRLEAIDNHQRIYGLTACTPKPVPTAN